MNKGIIIGLIGTIAAGVFGGLLATTKQENARLAASLADTKTALAAAESRPIPKPEVIERIVTVAKPGADTGQAAAEIARLKAALAEKATAPDTGEAPAEPRPRVEPPEERTPENMKSFNDRLKEEDPERYQRMQEQQKSFRDRAAQGFGERLNFFSELDVSGLSPEKMEVLTGTVEKLNEMSEVLAAIEENPDDIVAFELRTQAREMMREVSDAMRSTREVLVTDMIAGLGFNEQESNELKEYLGTINEMTSMRSIFRPPQRNTETQGDAAGGDAPQRSGGGPGRGPRL